MPEGKMSLYHPRRREPTCVARQSPFSNVKDLFSEDKHSNTPRELSPSDGYSDDSDSMDKFAATSTNFKPISTVGQYCYQFFLDHLHNPYPTMQQKKAMVEKANRPGVTLTSVSNWFSNSRRRSGWLEICNDYCGGDVKTMVEVCSRVLLDRCHPGDRASSGVAERIVAMQAKVRAWHDEQSKPSEWAIALKDLVQDLTRKLHLSFSTSVIDEKSTPTFDEESETDIDWNHSLPPKRKHIVTEDDLEAETTFSISSSCPSRSVSSSSANSLFDFRSSDEERRPAKRSRCNYEDTAKSDFSQPSSSKSTYTNKPHTSDGPWFPISLSKRKLSDDPGDDLEFHHQCKRIRIENLTSSYVSEHPDSDRAELQGAYPGASEGVFNIELLPQLAFGISQEDFISSQESTIPQLNGQLDSKTNEEFDMSFFDWSSFDTLSWTLDSTKASDKDATGLPNFEEWDLPANNLENLTVAVDNPEQIHSIAPIPEAQDLGHENTSFPSLLDLAGPSANVQVHDPETSDPDLFLNYLFDLQHSLYTPSESTLPVVLSIIAADSNSTDH